ncbi:hypothetical protein BJ170DRAFT_609026 [Xylariales sp. AK1849]|nr:hypothetical protein BJ170DRAFT_609026 [Xylariales sp. AK1849]
MHGSLSPSPVRTTQIPTGKRSPRLGTVGTSKASKMNVISDQDPLSPSTSRSTASASMAVSSDPKADSIITHAGQEPPRGSRFAMPHTFVGKLAASGLMPNTLPLPARVSGGGTGTRGRGRSRKKIFDGRTDIRSLPDFDGDPIEESEGD